MKKGLRIGISLIAISIALLVTLTNCSKSSDSNNANAPTVYTVGQSYGGGIIFYVNGTGQHGLIDCGSDYGGGSWGCDSISISGTDTAVGTGASNTAKILSSCPNNSTASRCHSLTINGYNDWFLPSIGELNLMYHLRTVIQHDFGYTSYWSSSEINSLMVWVLDDRGKFVEGHKAAELRYRPIRAF